MGHVTIQPRPFKGDLSFLRWDLTLAYIPVYNSSIDMVGAHQNLNGSRDLTTPFSGMVCHI